RHTRFSRDWSSDVCSSDLPRRTAHHLRGATSAAYGAALAGATGHLAGEFREGVGQEEVAPDQLVPDGCSGREVVTAVQEAPVGEIGRASRRDRGVSTSEST